MRSVLMSKFVPWPANSGEKRRTLAIARALKSVGDVTICGFIGANEEVDALIREGFDVRAAPLDRSWRKTLTGLRRGASLSAARFWDPEFARQVAEATSTPYDVLVVEHVQFQMYEPRWNAAFRIVDMHNIESLLAARVSATKSGLLKLVYRIDSWLLTRLEARALHADAVLVVSDADRLALESERRLPSVHVVPNGWDPAQVLPPAHLPIVSFVALLSWGPNVDAAIWFARRVWPLVLDQVPDARLQLVGRDPASEVQALASASVTVTGSVPDLEPWYEKTLVAVAPLLAGGGSRLKILEALSVGRPIIATTVGAEGLEDLIGEGVLVADEPTEMANRIASLLLDPSFAHLLGQRGAVAVAERHSWASAVKPLLRSVETGVGSVTRK